MRAFAASALLILTACSAAPAGDLRVISPADGSKVTSEPIQVTGTAPANAEIVQDISLAPDQRTQADASGNWTLTVHLDDGVNDLTFRIGDDKSTAQTIQVTLTTTEPATAVP